MQEFEDTKRNNTRDSSGASRARLDDDVSMDDMEIGVEILDDNDYHGSPWRWAIFPTHTTQNNDNMKCCNIVHDFDFFNILVP